MHCDLLLYRQRERTSPRMLLIVSINRAGPSSTLSICVGISSKYGEPAAVRTSVFTIGFNEFANCKAASRFWGESEWQSTTRAMFCPSMILSAFCDSPVENTRKPAVSRILERVSTNSLSLPYTRMQMDFDTAGPDAKAVSLGILCRGRDLAPPCTQICLAVHDIFALGRCQPVLNTFARTRNRTPLRKFARHPVRGALVTGSRQPYQHT